MNATQTEINYGVLDPALAIESMRANGYLNTDTALSELIDNSVDAGARTVEVFCYEEEVQLKQQRRSRVVRIGVLDDGAGMSRDRLRTSLRFGGRGPEDRRKIGRFGFGLPNSSISQCNRTTVWTWQSGHTNALRGYLDVAEIGQGTYREVPEPELSPLPSRVFDLAENVGRTGSYVEWSELGEGVTWKTGSKVVEHTGFLVGRIYRHYLTREEPLRILLHVVGPDGAISSTTEVKPNDPLYLMQDTSAPWDDEPMFQLFVDYPWEIKDLKGVSHTVHVKISYSKPSCRQPIGGLPAGSQRHGKHAQRNQGISIVRNDRELTLDDIIQTDPYRGRWIGCEINFPASLDEVFGVYNNKQGAGSLTEALKAFSRGQATTVREMMEVEAIEPGDPRVALYQMAQWLAENLNRVIDLVNKQQEGTGRSAGKRHDETGSVEDRTSKAFERRSEVHPTTEEQQEQQNPTPLEQQRKEGVASLVRRGYEQEDAERVMQVALDRHRRVLFLDSEASCSSESIFDIDIQPGVRQHVVMNRSHPAHANLVEMLDGDTRGAPVEELASRIQRASDTLKMLFAAWARMEFEAEVGEERPRIIRIRNDWSRMAADYLNNADSG